VIQISKPYIGDEEKQAVLGVLDSGFLAQGPQAAALEERFCGICGTRHAVSTSSGTTALMIALMAQGIGPGDEVITTPFTFIATINAILFCGATPVFVDIDAETYNIDPGLIEAAITPRTRALLPVHLYGYVCDMKKIMVLADRFGLAVIEDAAQAAGASMSGRKAGSFGTGCFSLYATKNIMSGEGGVITTNDDGLADRCRMIRSHGSRQRYVHEEIGYNFRISDLHAAIGVAQTGRLEAFTSKRRDNAAYLNENLQSVVTPTVKAGYDHVWHQYTVRVPDGMDRDEAVRKLQEKGIGTGVFYPIPAHKQPYLQAMGYGSLQLPVAEKAAEQVFSLPVHPQLSQEDLQAIAAGVNSL